MELNKIFGAILLAGVIAMTSGFLAELLIAPPHGEEEVAYMVEGGVPSQEPAEEEEEELPAIATLLASADPAAGEGQSRACAACHSFEEGGQNMVGPPLWDVVGREIASVEGFNYSGALQEYAAEAGTWSFEALNGFIHAPRDWVVGTSMSYQGVKDHEDRADLIAWMRTLSNDPEPLPEPPTEAAEGDAETQTADAGEAASGGEDEAAEETATAEPAAEESGAEAQETASSEEPAAEEAPAAEEPAAEDAGSEETETAEAEGDGAAGGEASGGASEFARMVASADPQSAQGTIATCGACHSFEQGGAARVGPNLWGIVGAPVAGVESFNYSQPMQDFGSEHGEWTYDLLDTYLEAPMEVVPGTRMAYPGVKDAEQRAAVVAYLRSLAEEPEPLPDAE
ncbi:MAG: c-type cytochrome [Azospirillaceae bacterium]